MSKQDPVIYGTSFGILISLCPDKRNVLWATGFSASYLPVLQQVKANLSQTLWPTAAAWLWSFVGFLIKLQVLMSCPGGAWAGGEMGPHRGWLTCVCM